MPSRATAPCAQPRLRATLSGHWLRLRELNHAELARRYRLRLLGECDSEVLALLLARGRGTITRRAVWAADQVAGDLALLGVWRRPDRLLVVRRGKPLHVGQGADGYYFASLPDGLPGRVRPISDHSARVLVCAEKGLQLEHAPLALAGDGLDAASPRAACRVHL